MKLRPKALRRQSEDNSNLANISSSTSSSSSATLSTPAANAIIDTNTTTLATVSSASASRVSPAPSSSFSSSSIHSNISIAASAAAAAAAAATASSAAATSYYPPTASQISHQHKLQTHNTQISTNFQPQTQSHLPTSSNKHPSSSSSIAEPPRKRTRDSTQASMVGGGNGQSCKDSHNVHNQQTANTRSSTSNAHNNNNNNNPLAQLAAATTEKHALNLTASNQSLASSSATVTTQGGQLASSPSSSQSVPSLKHGTSINAPSTSNITTSSSIMSTNLPLADHDSSKPSGSGNSANIPSFATVSSVSSDNDPEEIEMSRLQAILEARGVPSHLLGALGPRMQTLLHRTIGSSTSSKAHQLVQGLQAHGDEGQQLQSVMEMCQLLVMGNEDTLAGFPIKLAVPILIQLLNMEHNFDIMNHACRALTYMMESLPRSASIVVEAVPSFLEKLQSIQCMDVAEQSLTALEMLSKRHNRSILHAHGVSACLTFLDFFSINAQRSALTIAANCCQNLTLDEFAYIKDSLPILSAHLTTTDKKSVESICLAFSRLVEHYQSEPSILIEVAGSNLLENLTKLLIASPSIISMHTFVMIIRMMALMCQNCPELAVRLLSTDIVSTIRYLLVGQKSIRFGLNSPNKSSQSNDSISLDSSATSLGLPTSNVSSTKLNESVELLNRNPQELYEITSLAAELMPRLPSNGIFAIDALVSREFNPAGDLASVWQWRDDRGIWHRYSATDNKIIDSAHRAGDEETTLVTMGKTYLIDFTTMQQINEETEASRPIQRKLNYVPTNQNQPMKASNSSLYDTDKDHRIAYFRSHPEVLETFAESLLGILYEIYGSSAGASVRHKCLCAFLRIIYYTPVDSLRNLLKMHPVSSHIASMLASSDQKILVGAIQMATILMDKLPDIFSVYFRREGVLHQFSKLAKQTITPSKEKIKDWLVKEANIFEEKFLAQSEANSKLVRSTTPQNVSTHDSHPAMETLNKLTKALEMLDDNETMFEAVKQLKFVLSDGDISTFELIHSGLISKLTKFLTSLDENLDLTKAVNLRDNRIRAFLSVFLGLPRDPKHLLLLLSEQELKLDSLPLSMLTAKLNACITQLEQFPVRIHDLAGTGTGNTRGTSALKFFNTHQLKCNLQRHPQCTDLRQWRGGPVKIDPLAVVHAIEKYLAVRGYAKIRDSADNSDDNNTDDDIEESTTTSNLPPGRYRLQLSMNDHVLPHSMTVYQAIRQYGCRNSNGEPNADQDDNDVQLLGLSNVWSETHTIYYRPYVELGSPTKSMLEKSASQAFNKRGSSRNASSSSSGPSDLRLSLTSNNPSCSNPCDQLPNQTFNPEQAQVNSSSGLGLPGRRLSARNSVTSIYSSHNQRQVASRKRVDELWNEGKTPPVASPVDIYLQPKFPPTVTVKDPSLDIILLLKAIYGLNRHWSWFYRNQLSFKVNPIISLNEFVNNKLAAKATRQLQDPLVIMTNILPEWLSQITYNCPFLIPFESRQLLFYVNCFDRDRALQRLLDTTPELTTNDDRVTPRLDRRKKTINREEIFKHAESILNEMTNSKTVLEIQYENEVGTGLGPTLEFYALMSRELQSADLEMWRGEVVSASRPLIPQIDAIAGIKQAGNQYNPSPSSSIVSKTCVEQEPIQRSSARNQKYNSVTNLHVRSHQKEVKSGKSSHNPRNKSSHLTLTTQPPVEYVPTKISFQEKKYVYSPSGLFPLPIARNAKTGSVSKLRNRYKLLGRFMARALMDSRMIDISLSLPFYKWLLSLESTFDLSDMVDIDPTMSRTLFQLHRISQLYQIMVYSRTQAQNSGKAQTAKVTTAKSIDKLRQQVGSSSAKAVSDDIFTNISPEVLTLDGCPVEDLDLDFTLPGYSTIELKKGGKDTEAKLENLDQYVTLLRHWTLTEGIKRQMEAFKAGFESIIPIENLKLFYPEELDLLFCGSGYQNWDVRMLMDACKTDHGFTHESIQIKYLFDILSLYNADEQRKFLQFITGSPRLPYGGIKSLSPPLTIVRKTLEPGQNPDHFLPSVMTCVNYLKLPEYSSQEIMREKLRVSSEEGRNYFHLS